MSADKGAMHAENGAVVEKRGKRKTIARHCRRFWWLHLILFILGAVLFVCIAIFVVVPKVAQSKINGAKLEMQGVNILKTTSNTYLLEINSTIKTDGSTKADIDAFTGVMYLEDLEAHTPFVSIDFPATNGNKHQKVNISQEITIKDMDAFTQFNTWFAVNDTLRVTVFGHTKVKPSGLNRKSKVHFKKTLTIKGLNLFKGTTVPAATAKISTAAGVKQNFNGTSIIPNQSVFTLDIGNVTFINFIDGKKTGLLTIQDLLLVPGNNSVKFEASSDQDIVISAVTSPKYCKTGVVPTQLLGDTVTNMGQNLSYFASALASANQTVPIDIGAIIKQSQGFSLGCLSA